MREKQEIQSISGINFLLGAWLIISPYILGYTSGSEWNQTILGIVVVVLAAIRAFAPEAQWASFLNGLAGIWAIIAPAFIFFSGATYWNEIIVGIVLGLLAFWNSSIHIGSHQAPTMA